MVTHINKYIDHTLLKAEATESQIIALCKEAESHHFMSVCVNPYWVKKAAESLAGSDVKVCTVIGFPLGAAATEIKMAETKQAIEDGADEVDMVINIGELKGGNKRAVREDIQSVVASAGGRALVKVIIETALLTDEEKIRACELAKEAGADFVKTSTGFSTGGATIADVALMRKTVGPQVGVKASGGVKSREDALKFIEAGATRLGSSNGVAIVESLKP
ncbi:Deoxyribose-phosphate aldolase [Propionispora sp. 2/2-37]|nr:deoxyribose-phosphate aldolase [Propionispora sp. 2/2-37]CUH96706.1 Deoxyribose-phosphate aldolase [Propionispora sp. 2/2-37]